MFTKLCRQPKQGFSLVEMLVAVGLFGIASTALMSIYLFSTRSFAVLANYAELDQINRLAVDTLTKEIRQAKLVSNVTGSSISLINGDGVSVTYNFNRSAGNLTRFASDGSSKTLLSHCSLINFDVYQRNNISNTFNQYPVATANWSEYVKVIRLTWKASRPVPGGPGVSENVQTAQVVIRKQH